MKVVSDLYCQPASRPEAGFQNIPCFTSHIGRPLFRHAAAPIAPTAGGSAFSKNIPQSVYHKNISARRLGLAPVSRTRSRRPYCSALASMHGSSSGDGYQPVEFYILEPV